MGWSKQLCRARIFFRLLGSQEPASHGAHKQGSQQPEAKAGLSWFCGFSWQRMSGQTLLFNSEFPSFLHLMPHRVPDAPVSSTGMCSLLQLISTTGCGDGRTQAKAAQVSCLHLSLGKLWAGPCTTHPLHPHCWRQGSSGIPHPPAYSLALLPWKSKFLTLDCADASKCPCTAPAEARADTVTPWCIFLLALHTR